MLPELHEIPTERLILWAAGPEAAPRLHRYHAENWPHLAPWSPPVPPDFLTVGYWERRLIGERAAIESGRAARSASSRHEIAQRAARPDSIAARSPIRRRSQ